MPVGGTSRFSMPCVVPSQLTLQPRACIFAATARPGITWPPVPAAMTTRWRGAASKRRSVSADAFMRGLRASELPFSISIRSTIASAITFITIAEPP